MWLSTVLVIVVKALVGASPRWIGSNPSGKQRIYFSNHTSHIDAVAIWSAIPSQFRRRTRPVAAADYWDGGALRRYAALKALNAVLVWRNREVAGDPLAPIEEALSQGDSLIFFPEGTRRAQRLPSEFKSGLYHLAQHFPDVELIPVYLENLHRIMPKGTHLPVPLVCTVRFGAPVVRVADEDKQAFLMRAKAAVEALA